MWNKYGNIVNDYHGYDDDEFPHDQETHCEVDISSASALLGSSDNTDPSLAL